MTRGMMLQLAFMFLWVCLMPLGSCSTCNDYPLSDHYDGRRFFNPNGVETSGFLGILKHVIMGRRGQWPTDYVKNCDELNLNQNLHDQQIALTLVNHATVLIQSNRLNVLTDPIWSMRAGPLGWLGPKRAHLPGIPFEKLPKIDLVLVSHNHYDHLDLQTLRHLQERDDPMILVPLGLKKFLAFKGIHKVEELDWWQSFSLDHNHTITLTPAQHHARRGLLDSNKTLWGGFVLESLHHRVFFAGDTGYADHFQAIKSRLGPIDVALLPIGAYEPRIVMKKVHMDPEEAVQAMMDLEARYAFGIHFGTFQLTSEDFDAPVKDLQSALKQKGTSPDQFIAPCAGKTYLYQ